VQAEDGIRYWSVTGVQTCALPISAKMDLREIKHRTDVVGGFFLSAHSDVEIPCGCCIFQAGVRLAYDYIWTDILQSRNDDLQTEIGRASCRERVESAVGPVEYERR